MKVSLLTLGCRVNQSETAVLEGTLRKSGVDVVTLEEKPDYCIVNTCTVTAKSDYNSRQLIRRAARTGAGVIVTGCYAQMRPGAVKQIDGVLHVIENCRKHEIPRLITGNEVEPDYSFQTRSRPHLKIQDGCNFSCSYCLVPLARGKSRSISPDEVVARAARIESAGYKELVLTGIHLGTYGHDLPSRMTLSRMIRMLLDETGIHRIRLSSLEINELDAELLELLTEPRLCKHLHLPLQSGSPKVLSAMRRSYQPSDYLKKCEAISKRAENISIGTDIIIGFPAEDDHDFDDTYNLVKSLPLSYLHVFPFSPRPGTDAYIMAPRTSVKRDRLERMRLLDREKRLSYMTSQFGRTLEIIVEEHISEKHIAGTSSNYLKITAHSVEHSPGSLVNIRPEAVERGSLWGIVIP